MEFKSLIIVIVIVIVTTKGLQDRNIHIYDGTTVANKGKLILPVLYLWKSEVGATPLFFCLIHLIYTSNKCVVFKLNLGKRGQKL